MYQRCFEMSHLDKNIILRTWLCLVWIAGLSLGFCAARSYGDSFAAFIKMTPDVVPSFWGALSVNVLPLLISACAVFFLRSIVFPICFFRAVSFGLGLGLIALSYSGAGLMMSGLVMFSALLFAPVLLWYWCRRLELGRRLFRHDTVLCLLIGLFIAGMDVWMVSPFLREVMNF